MSDLYFFKSKNNDGDDIVVDIGNLEVIEKTGEGVTISHNGSSDDTYLHEYDVEETCQLINLASNDGNQKHLPIKSTVPFLKRNDKSPLKTPEDIYRMLNKSSFGEHGAPYQSTELDALQIKKHVGLGGNYAFTDSNGIMFDGVLHDISDSGGIFVIPTGDNVKSLTKTVVAKSMHYMEGESPKGSKLFLKDSFYSKNLSKGDE